MVLRRAKWGYAEIDVSVALRIVELAMNYMHMKINKHTLVVGLSTLNTRSEVRIVFKIVEFRPLV